MNRSAMRIRKFALAVLLVVLAASSWGPRARAATPYEAQIGGFMAAAVSTLITGEFAGRKPSNADAVLDRRICKPNDYDDLRAAANDSVAFDAFHRRCHLTEPKISSTDVVVTADLPPAYCETLKAAFAKMLDERVYADPDDPSRRLVFEYKGSRFDATSRQLARGARFELTCLGDGALRISTPRKRR